MVAGETESLVSTRNPEAAWEAVEEAILVDSSVQCDRASEMPRRKDFLPGNLNLGGVL